MEKKLILGAVIAIIVLGAVLAIPNIGNQDLHRFKLQKFELTNDFVIPDRICFAKISTIATVGGELFEADQSTVSSGNANLNLSFIAGDAVNVIDGFIIQPKFLCQTVGDAGIDPSLPPTEKAKLLEERVQGCLLDKDGENCNVTSMQTMVYDVSELSVKVISEDTLNETHVVSYQETITTNEVSALDGQEVKLAEYKILVSDLEDDLPPGQYTSWQEFRISGTIKMHPEVCSSCNYSYYIEDGSIQSYHQVIVQKETGEANIDTDGDGVNDANASGKQNDALAKEEEDKKSEQKSGEDPLSDMMEFVDCLIVTDTECLNQGKFAMIWFGLAILGGFFVLGILIIIIQSFRGGNRN